MTKKQRKEEREKAVLFGLIELFTKEAKAIGSKTLMENGFEKLSSATIRNYFAKLESEGYLEQMHSSGGRIPTPAAFRLYAREHEGWNQLDANVNKKLENHLNAETRNIAKYLGSAAEHLSETMGCAIFLSSPRFDQDMMIDIKLIGIDHTRLLAVMITDFGNIYSEVLYSPNKLSNFSLKRIEAYFRFRMTGFNKPELTAEEEKLAHDYYNELVLRHIVGYTNFSSEDLLKTGFSKLLNYPEFREASALANSLALFEDSDYMGALLKQTIRAGELKQWIGEELNTDARSSKQCAILSIPYAIHGRYVGAIALLGPMRLPYKEVFAILKRAQELISETLTKNLYKFKITYRTPRSEEIELRDDAPSYLGDAHAILIEDQRG